MAHACTKSAAFFAAGMVQQEQQTTALGELRGLWRKGRSGRFLLAALAALSGMPPFALFVSELLVVLAGVAAHRWGPLILGLVGMSLAFAAISRTAIEIESGRTGRKKPSDGGVSRDASIPGATVPRPVAARLRLATMATALALAGAISLAAVPWTSLGAALQTAASAIGIDP
jgi:hydrogenase-4 component F